MMTDPAPQVTPDHSPIIELAARHGLELEAPSLRVEDIGLDFQVALTRAVDGREWVLRIPRRADVVERAAVEGRLLAAVAPRLSVAVPDWQIHTAELIAYPLLPGSPGLTLDADGTPQWHLDMASTTYAQSLAAFLAQLHAVDPAVVRETGIELLDADGVRRMWRDRLDRVADEFQITPSLWERWSTWIDEDSYWPPVTALTHGEVYPAHTLVKDERITAVLDWTTASVADPAKDFAFHQASAPPEVFDALVRHYVDLGGRVWPRLAEHCAQLMSASAIEYGLFALMTGDPQHRAAAAAGLNPAAE